MSVDTLQGRWMTRLGEHWRPDYRTAGFTLAMLAMQAVLVGLLAVVDLGVLVGQEPYGDPNSVGTLGHIAGIAAAEALGIVGLYKLYQWLPEWLQDIVSGTILTTVVFGFGLVVTPQTPEMYLFALAVWAGCIFSVSVISEFELAWLGFNGLAILFGALLAVVLATALSPWLVVVLVAALTVLDPIGVHVLGYIQRFAGIALDIGLPIGIVVPDYWRFPLDDLTLSDGDGAGNASIIGLGDYALPLAFAVAMNRLAGGAVVTVGGYQLSAVALGALAGAVAGVMFLSGRFHTHDDAIPALPAMMAWVLIGTAIGVVA